ncbi:MAG TPA: hypothetical protein VJL29_13735 [Thermoguttaceae bacterium]|nr:hypothetical protein [Thermoguttaceae bacterium]
MTDFPVLLADTATRTMFELGRIQSNSDLILPVVVAVSLMVLARLIYRSDAQELRPVVGWALTLLRTAVIFALLLLYLQPQWRTEREHRVNSRVLVLVDNSLSMGLSDDTTGTGNRADQVATALARIKLVEQLLAKHDVGVFRFGEKLEPIGARPRADETEKENAGTATPGGSFSSTAIKQNETIDWKAALVPAATQTRLGESLDQLIEQQQDAPVSGIILITDGRQNAGASPEAATAAARLADIPVFPIGVGSDRQVANVRISDFVVPARAYPGDAFTATGYLQAARMAGRKVTVELFTKQADAGKATSGDGELVESREVLLGGDGEVVPVRFELSPKEPGRQTLTLKVKAPPEDRNPGDDRREADVETVDRKDRVLLLAGGPMREYQFLRNLLHRDASVVLDVLLQTARPGVSQEAHRLLDDFPTTREEMYRYDAVVALDPDWQKLSDEQINLLESWVAEQGGGLILAAGTVQMGNTISGWVQDERMATIRSLYPVRFQRRFATDEASYASSEPWPLDFTREGLEAEFLWLADNQTAGEAAWAAFPGVFSFYPVDGAKPGATVLARFSDPQFGPAEQRPVYAASQFYGSGRVIYFGSAEWWRLRGVDETYFETLYTKLLRHVSQGRLLRGSRRGAVLIDRDRYMLGATVEVRAQLTDARLEPLAGAGVPLEVYSPDGTMQTVTLSADPSRAGSFAGRFSASAEGAWRLELPIPESANERLSRRIQVKMPDLERETPERNDPLLARLAAKTAGRYYVGFDAAFPAGGAEGLIERLKDRTKTVIVTSPPSRLWQERWLRWFMYLICGLLLAEWLIRRLMKLA